MQLGMSRTAVVLYHLYDAMQVVAAVVDVSMDLLVLRAFAAHSDPIFFRLSLANFALAQIAYAFLFTATLGRHLSTVRGFVLTFLAVLPLSQLVPIFTWVESMHVAWVDRAILTLGLKPTAKKSHASEDADALWSFFHNKWQANAGFLVEAIVEAIPQALLQTTFVLVTGQTDSLVVGSILLSLFVIASKGYLFCFALDIPTLLFNCCCVFFDVASLFACLVWAFAAPGDNLVDTLLPGEISLPLYVWKWSTLLATGSLTVVLFFLVAFAACDDHLKICLGRTSRASYNLRLVTGKIWFDIYAVRMVLLVFAPLPATAVALTLRLSLLPVCKLRTINSQHSAHPEAFRLMFAYARRGGAAEEGHRLLELNKLLRLIQHSGTLAGMPFQALLSARASYKGSDGEAIRLVLRNLINATTAYHFRRDGPKLFARTLEPLPSDPAGAAKQVLKENRNGEMARTSSELERRSSIVAFLRDANWRKTMEADSSVEYRLRIAGTFCLAVLVFVAPTAAVSLGISALSGAFVALRGPMLWWTACVVHTGGQTLGLCLTGACAVSGLAALALFPRVRSFQQLALTDIVDAPDEFFSSIDLVVDEAYRTYRIRLGERKLEQWLAVRTNSDCARLTLSYLAATPSC